MVLDATASTNLPSYAHGTRIPKWVLPSLDETTRTTLRPDILLIPTIKPREHTNLHDTMIQLTPEQRAQHTGGVAQLAEHRCVTRLTSR